MVIFSARVFTDLTDYDPSDPESSIPEPDFTLIAAVQCQSVEDRHGIPLEGVFHHRAAGFSGLSVGAG